MSNAAQDNGSQSNSSRRSPADKWEEISGQGEETVETISDAKQQGQPTRQQAAAVGFERSLRTKSECEVSFVSSS